MSHAQVTNALTRLAHAESKFLATEFFAPVVRGRGVMLNIAKVHFTLRVVPGDYRGWGIFRPISHTCARVVRVASAEDRRQYLDLFPAIRLIVLARAGDSITAIAANESDRRFEVSGPTIVRLAFDVDIFDTVLARFDGAQFWFDEIDPRADPAAAVYLRRELATMTDPTLLSRSGLTGAHRSAYALYLARRINEIRMDRRHREESRLASALAQAGASLRDFSDAGNSHRVTYTVDGVRHVSVVRKNDLTVLSAGICLSGEDRAFDLNSLVGVLREGAAVGRF